MSSVKPERLPPDQYSEDVVTVIKPDGAADPSSDPGLTPAEAQSLYRGMVRTRMFDIQLERLQRQGRIGFHVGSLGEEACIIGSAAAFADDDFLLPCYREFGAILLRGLPLQTYLHNMYGNAEDIVKGRQMPDHYTGKPYHFGSVSSPIGTQITQGVGYAWASQLRGTPVALSLIHI